MFPELSYKIIGLCFKVYNELGRFRNERQYADCLEKLLRESKVLFNRETALKKSFDGEQSNRNIPDFIIENKILLDIKTKRLITRDDYFQMRRYLESTKKELGIIVNFRQRYLTPRRILNPLK